MQVSGMQLAGQVSGSAGGAAMIQQMRDRMFARADKDGDGGLSRDEFKALARRPLPGSAGNAGGAAANAAAPAAPTAFSALDTNGDGKLSGAELEQGRRSHRHHGGAAVSADGLSALLGAQEGSGGQATAGAGLQAMMARLLQAYGGGPAVPSAV